MRTVPCPSLLAAVLLALPAAAGPYSAASGDAANPFDAPVPGFVGPHGTGKARLLSHYDENGDPVYENPDNHVNPLFFGWATEVIEYDASEFVSAAFADPESALYPVTGDHFNIVSLGDLSSAAIVAGSAPGTITLTFAKPIRNLSGADFVIFENGHLSESNQGGAGIGGLFAELAHVEVSSGGSTFVRMPATSLTAAAVGPYGSIDPTKVHNLAGKHLNAYGDSWGTPFDLSAVGLEQITHLRLVDIPGNGAFHDAANRPVYDAWRTVGSGGFDLEAIGAIAVAMTYAEWPQLLPLPVSQRGTTADPDGDGAPNLLEYACGSLPWKADAVHSSPVQESGQTGLTFLRDERLVDVIYQVQVSENLIDWTTLATGTGGAAMQAAIGRTPVIADVSAGTVQSVGVIRKTTVSETPPAGSSARYYRLQVTRAP